MGSSHQPKSSGRGRGSFVRTSVSTTERLISVGIVILLAAIGAAIWRQGNRFNPGQYSLRADALRSTATSVSANLTVPKASPPPAAPTPDGYDEGNMSSPVTATPTAILPLPADTKVPLDIPGFAPTSDTEFYSPENLFEKIDGRAPAYLGFHFQQLRNRTFSLPGDASSYVDIYEYRMDSPINAFGIYSLERDPGGQPLDFVTDGYSGGMGLFFRQGSCYIQVLASDQKPGTLEFARQVAKKLSVQIPKDDAGLNARRKLPSEGMVAESLSFVQDNAMGQDFLKDVFQADYDFQGKRLSFFLMVTTPELAAAAWEAYMASSGKYGGLAERLPDFEGARCFQSKNFGKWRVIYQRGGEIGGIVGADDPNVPKAFVDQLLKNKSR